MTTRRQKTSIIFNGTNNQIHHLPLDEVWVNAVVVDVSAKIIITHIFSNPSEDSTGRAKYVFPVPARAAVCGFAMKTSDGREVVGVAKESQKAENEYRQALEKSKVAGLVQWGADDVFTISVGSIPAHGVVVTKITLVMHLMDDDHPNEIRFHLPMSVGTMRYGTPHPSTINSLRAPPHTSLRIAVKIQTSGLLESVSSPSHTIALTPHRTHHGQHSNRRTTASLRSSEFLNSDFVLIIRAEGLDAPRCFAELDDPGSETRARTTAGEDSKPTVAVQLTVVPKFGIQPLPAQEYLFLVDRSGSMQGDRIETAKDTLMMLLKAIPSSGATLNIFSFGSQCTGLWQNSEAYSQISVDQAMAHTQSMQANCGGTETRLALTHVFSRRKRSMPTVIFILTDGEDHDIEQTLKAVAAAVAQSTPSAPLRIFVLGIGNTVSTAMCEGIARVGNGLCLMAVNSTEIVGKCAQLLRAGRTRLLKDVTVDWGVTEDADLNTTSSRRIQFPPPPFIRQTPSAIQTLYPGLRLVVYAIFQTEKVPSKVTIKGTLGDGEEVLNLSVPVEPIRLSLPSPSGRARSAAKAMLIHTLAAHRLIQDLQEGRGPMPGAAFGGQAITKGAIVELGERYQLASEYTSFVAVDSGVVRQAPERHGRGVVGNAPERHRRGAVASSRRDRRQGQEETNEWIDVPADEHEGAQDLGYVSWALGALWSGLSWALGRAPPATSNARQPTRRRTAATERADYDSADVDEDDEVDDSDPEEDYDSAATYSTMSSLESYSSRESSPGRARPRRRRRPVVESSPPPSRPQSESRSPSPEIQPNRPASGGLHDAGSSSQNPAPLQRDIPVPVIDLVRLQAFDGSFVLGRDLERIVGPAAVNEWGDMGDVESEVWATALAVAFLEKHSSGQAELIECLKDKIMDYIDGKPQMEWADFLALVRRAERLVV